MKKDVLGKLTSYRNALNKFDLNQSVLPEMADVPVEAELLVVRFLNLVIVRQDRKITSLRMINVFSQRLEK